MFIRDDFDGLARSQYSLRITMARIFLFNCVTLCLDFSVGITLNEAAYVIV